jgi:predicted GH43/DUF377 family glycosyl hydrolase
MSIPAGRRIHRLPCRDLLPDAWRALADAGPIHCFNPGLLACDDGWLLAYRVVASDGWRRIALCRLTASLEPIAGSAVPLSDRIEHALARDAPEQARRWFADPRLYRLDGRLYVQWNSGWHVPNHQFLQELDAANLAPLGPARELRLAGERQPIEKNWTLLGDTLHHAVYAPAPHQVLELAAEDSTSLLWRVRHVTAWDVGDFTLRYGPLRGGAPPQRHGRHYVSFCHAVFGSALGYCYVAAAYRFAAEPPFRPVAAPARPLRLSPPGVVDLRGESLNPATHRVVYPCGAAVRDGWTLISYGVDDTHCAIAVLPSEEVEAAMRPLPHLAGSAA